MSLTRFSIFVQCPAFEGEDKMIKAVFKVEGMSCGHCAKAITEAIEALPGVANVAVDLATKSVTVEYDPSEADMDKIKAEIEEMGYNVCTDSI